MCLAIPSKVIEINDQLATVEIDGIRRSASLMLLDDVALNDYVIVHAGFAIHKIDPVEAEQTIELFREAAKTECFSSGNIV
jgi:hydrogenase expression/formation protein HypC